MKKTWIKFSNSKNKLNHKYFFSTTLENFNNSENITSHYYHDTRMGYTQTIKKEF